MKLLTSMLLLVSTSHLEAIPITGGHVIFEGDNKAVSLDGPNFSVSGVWAVGFTPRPCDVVCLEGDLLDTLVFIYPDLVGFLHGTVDGVFYPALSIGNVFTGPVSGFVISTPGIMVTDQLVYTAPFRAEGDLLLITCCGECVLCGPLDPNGFPVGIPVTGSGHVTIELQPRPGGEPGELVFKRAVYQFEVPESSTFAMLAMAIAGYGFARVFLERRHQGTRTPAPVG